MCYVNYIVSLLLGGLLEEVCYIASQRYLSMKYARDCWTLTHKRDLPSLQGGNRQNCIKQATYLSLLKKNRAFKLKLISHASVSSGT